MKNFLLIKNSDKDREYCVTNQIRRYIAEAGGATWMVERSLEEMREPLEVPKGCDCIMVLGGDGSILRTERAVYPSEIPLVGVNLGNLGFLTQTEPEDVTRLLDHLLQDDIRLEKRMMLQGTMYHEGEQVYQDIALNDIVVSRSGLSRIIRLRIHVNGELLNVYDADGVVISTPTGSTAYNLSAGGPVVCPRTNLLVVTPISSHSFSARSVILSEEDVLRIELEPVRTAREEAAATFDGQTGRSMLPSDVIEICRSPHDANLVRLRHSSFYEVLRNKMQ